MKKFWEDEEYVEEEIFEDDFFEEEEYTEEELFENVIEEESEKKYFTIDTLSISDRPGPGRLKGYLRPGEVEILEEIEDWVRVKQGWIPKRFLRTTE